jgi:hypothetical protein
VGIGALLRNIPKVAYLAGVFGLLVLLVVLTSWLVLRDTWERDHRMDVLRLSEESISLIHAKKIADGVAKYDALLQLVGKRNLTDPDITKAMTDARKVTEPLWQKFDEARRLDAKRQQVTAAITKLRGLESQAKAFIDANDLKHGIEKYQQAIDLIKDTQSDDAELTAAIERLSLAQKCANDKLELARKNAEQEAYNHQQEAKGLVKFRGKWMTKEQYTQAKSEFPAKAIQGAIEKASCPRVTITSISINKNDDLVYPYTINLKVHSKLSAYQGYRVYNLMCGIDLNLSKNYNVWGQSMIFKDDELYDMIREALLKVENDQ